MFSTRIRQVIIGSILICFVVKPLLAQPIDYSALKQKMYALTYSEQLKLMRTLPENREIKFGNNRSFTLGRFIGSGAMSAVYEVVGDPEVSVIKLPLFLRDNRGASAGAMIPAFVSGYDLLRKYAGNHVVHILENFGEEYVAVSRLPQDSVAGDKMYRVDVPTRRRAMDALLELADSTAAFDRIGDFKSAQLAYSPSENAWKIADWAHSRAPQSYYHVLFNPENPESSEFNSCLDSYLKMLNLQKTPMGFEEIPQITQFAFAGVPLEERLAFARKLESRILKRRQELALSDQFRRDAASNTFLKGDEAPSIIKRPPTSHPTTSTPTTPSSSGPTRRCITTIHLIDL